MTPKRKFSYYNFAKLLSYNATMNHCVGGRGIGKTYGAKKKVLRDAIKDVTWTTHETTVTKRGKEYVETNKTAATRTQFIYVRRYKDELSLSKQSFFTDIQHEFPDWEFRVQGMEAQMSPIEYAGMKKGRPWIVMGYFVPLSIAQSFKSVAFDHVKWIIFDEYILEKGATHYLPNEATAFNNFYSTVDRYQNRARVLFLANSVTITNPYFLEYEIRPEDVDENNMIRKSGGYMIVEFIQSEKYEAEVYSTPFGKFIQGTEYANYAVGNQFNDNHKHLIGLKGPKAYHMFTLESKHGVFSVWFDVKEDKYFCQEKLPKDGRIITLEPTKMAENKTLMLKTDRTLAMLRVAFNHDRVRFDTPVSRNAFVEIFK